MCTIRAEWAFFLITAAKRMKMKKINIGKDIKNIRKKLHLTQAELADLFNKTPPKKIRVHRRDISKYETGTYICPTEKYVKFLNLLD